MSFPTKENITAIRHSRVAVLFSALLIAASVGCKGSPINPASWGQQQQQPAVKALTLQEVNSGVMGFADTFTMRISQACDEVELEYGKGDPGVRRWAQATKIGQAFAAMDIATGPNPEINLLDMVAMVTLKREAVQEYDIPVVLKGKGKEVIDHAYQRSYDEVWALADRDLNDEQLKELRDLIDQWRKDNPKQYYVGFVRLEDFSSFKKWQESPHKAAPGSLFSLLYIDPLAGLDPVAQELRGFQDLTSRMLFILQRLPIIMQWQMRREIDAALSNESVTQFVTETGNFSAATAKFADAVAAYPDQFKRDTQDMVKQLQAAITAERVGMFDEANKTLTNQREAMFKSLDDQTTKLGQVVDKIDKAIASLDQAGTSINDSTTKTVTVAETSTRSLLNHAFLLAVALIVIILAAMLTYRATSRRMSQVRGAETV